MADLIERQAAIDAALDSLPDDEYWNEQVCKAINKLPPAQPLLNQGQPRIQSSDCISRQAVIDAIVAWTVEDRPDAEMPTDLIGRVRGLPSVQPEPDSAYTEGYTQAEAKYRKMWDDMQANIKEKAFGKRKGLIHTADIDSMPTIEERKTGKWIHDNTLKQFFCSECGEPSLTDDDRYIYSMDFPNYCPNCGARLVQEGEDNDG